MSDLFQGSRESECCDSNFFFKADNRQFLEGDELGSIAYLYHLIASSTVALV